MGVENNLNILTGSNFYALAGEKEPVTAQRIDCQQVGLTAIQHFGQQACCLGDTSIDAASRKLTSRKAGFLTYSISSSEEEKEEALQILGLPGNLKAVLWRAVEKGNIPLVEYLRVCCNVSPVETVDEHRQNALHHLCAITNPTKKHLELAAYLIHQGNIWFGNVPDDYVYFEGIASRDGNDTTPLHLACRCSSADMVKKLLEESHWETAREAAFVTEKDSHMMPLHYLNLRENQGEPETAFAEGVAKKWNFYQIFGPVVMNKLVDKMNDVSGTYALSNRATSDQLSHDVTAFATCQEHAYEGKPLDWDWIRKTPQALSWRDERGNSLLITTFRSPFASRAQLRLLIEQMDSSALSSPLGKQILYDALVDIFINGRHIVIEGIDGQKGRPFLRSVGELIIEKLISDLPQEEKLKELDRLCEPTKLGWKPEGFGGFGLDWDENETDNIRKYRQLLTDISYRIRRDKAASFQKTTWDDIPFGEAERALGPYYSM